MKFFPLVEFPCLGIKVENAFTGKRYPESGEVVAIIDTGYEGFLMLPEDIFTELEFSKLSMSERTLLMPDGRILKTKGTYGFVIVNDYRVDGFIETSEIGEIILGLEFLSNFRITFDFCLKRLEIDTC